MKNGFKLPKKYWNKAWLNYVDELWTNNEQFNSLTKIVDWGWHRTDGPAIVYTSGYNNWMLDNHEYSFNEFCKKTNLSDEEIIILRLKFDSFRM